MKTEFQVLAQQILNERANAGLKLDGDFGRLSATAAFKWTNHLNPPGNMTHERWAALVIQHGANLSGKIPHQVKTDGWWGPVTEDAAYRLLGHTFERPDEQDDQDDQDNTAATPPAAVRCWTPKDSQMIAKYGQPGTNQIRVLLPFAMRLDWDLNSKVSSTQCHRLVGDKLTAALEDILKHYGMSEIQRLGIDRFGGVLNVRKKRGGSTWSAHAWGTAIDLWPSMNQLAWKKDRAVFAKPEYKEMHEAFTRYGWMSLGKCYDFDHMHFQVNP